MGYNMALEEKKGEKVTETQSSVKPDPVESGLTTSPFSSQDEGEKLLEQVISQWQCGEWQSLTELDLETLQRHPDRGRLILFVATARFQTGNEPEAKRLIRLVLGWGMDKNLVSRILVSGVHNSLACAHMTMNDDKCALNHFKDAIQIVLADAERLLAGQTRMVREAARLGLLPQAARLLNARIKDVKNSKECEMARIKIIETEIGLLNNELSLALQKQQLYAPDQGIEITIGSESWKEQLKKKSVSQLGQDLWVLEKTNYKQGGFFVEFGATDGVLLSNTWLLEKEFGWEGICADPNPRFYNQLKKNRQCIVSDQCIGKETGENIEFVLADVYGGNRKYANEDKHKEKREAYATAGRVVSLVTISLHNFLLQYNAPKKIDYISVDTEGSEFEILQNFRFDEWDVRLLTVEHNFFEQRKKISDLMKRNGYALIERQWDDWYEKI